MPIPLIEKYSPEIQSRIQSIHEISQYLPGVVVIHDVDFNVVYLSPKGLKEIGTTLEALQELGSKYIEVYYPDEDIAEYLPRLKELIERNNPDETFSYFQQVKYVEEGGNWVWNMVDFRIFAWDEAGKPLLTIVIGTRIDQVPDLIIQAEKIRQDNNFIREKYQLFSKLGKREKEVLQHVAIGLNTSEIAGMMHISYTTAETHRRNIRKKLSVDTNMELHQYARAFGLI
jgi:DNA-binding CsgD family transcriptional regulator